MSTTTLEIKSLPTGSDAPPKDGDRPAWLPEKFKTAEEMATAYTELEKKQGGGGTGTDLSTTAAATEALQKVGLDFSKLSAEYVQNNGKLTDASLALLKEKGFTENNVNQFIEGQKALSRENEQSVFNAVGGKERFDKLQEFAVSNLSPKEVESYNEALKRGDYSYISTVMQNLNTKFEKTFGSDGNLTNGGSPRPVVDAYANFAEYRQALRDPRYSTDAHYRDTVDKKLERSSFFKQ